MTEEFVPLNLAVLTVSDTRTEATDTSGKYLADQLKEAGHVLVKKQIIKDEVTHIRSVLSDWISSENIHAIVVTGGTGFSGRDSTPEAVSVLFDKVVDGFGELFRHLSYQDIGSSTVQSRALAGLANRTIIFCLPGSTGACRLAWEKIIKEQLDNRHKPCNFVKIVTGN
jgi:molybdenum cofactor biosynthesis protein B